MEARPADGDETIVRGLRRGDTAAFDAAYVRYRPRVHAFLVRLCRRADLAEDLLQETWLRLARNAPTLAEGTRLAPWLFTVARNLYISHRRWALLDTERLSALRFWARDEGSERTPFEQLAANETERRLERALASLPVAQREVVLLLCVERLEQDEAASVLGIAPDALRQRLSRARAALAAALEEGTSQPGNER